MLLLICKCFLWFTAYSVAGWIWEVILFCFTEKKFINRGFLYGPSCPIYGAGALLMWLTLGRFSNVFLLFFAGGLMACLMEYIISYALEKMFHTRWWDYTRNRFNINGRVCLLGFTAFGVFAVLVVKWVQPFVIWVTDMIWEPFLLSAGLVIFVTTVIDFVVTISQLCKLNEKLRELQVALDQKLYSSEAMKKLVNTATPAFRRFARAFPRMHSTLYDGALQKIMEKIRGSQGENSPEKKPPSETSIKEQEEPPVPEKELQQEKESVKVQEEVKDKP